MSLRIAFALTAVVVVAVSAAWTACSAGAASAHDSKFQQNLEATVGYLQKAQQEDGGFTEPGREPEVDFSAWVTIALAAAGINPRDQTTAKQHYQAGHSAFGYLAENAHEASLTTDFERELLVVDAAGTSPHDFGGVDLVGEILKRQIDEGHEAGGFSHEAGSTSAGVNDTVFAILALSPIHEPAVEEAIEKASVWLEAQQGCDGSWPSVASRSQPARTCGSKRELLAGEEAGEVDMTAAAIEALNAAKHDDPKQAWAFEFLREAQAKAANGGFSEQKNETVANVASTAWAVQAMWSAGINPEEWKTGLGQEPLGYLASMQQEDGHIRYEAGEEMNGMWMTAYVTPAFVGDPLPIPAVTFEELPLSPPKEPGTGGGVGSGSSKGVIVGGGGSGAKLFSRPQPKSKGHTPGGIRQLNSKAHERPSTHKLNPGPMRRQAAPTTTSTTASKRARAAKPTPVARETEVKGVLIGGPKVTNVDDVLKPGAPGLRGAGGDQSQWLATAIYVAIVLLILAGALIERRRPQRAL